LGHQTLHYLFRDLQVKKQFELKYYLIYTIWVCFKSLYMSFFDNFPEHHCISPSQIIISNEPIALRLRPHIPIPGLAVHPLMIARLSHTFRQRIVHLRFRLLPVDLQHSHQLHRDLLLEIRFGLIFGPYHLQFSHRHFARIEKLQRGQATNDCQSEMERYIWFDLV
jgi:hypothetical protein